MRPRASLVKLAQYLLIVMMVAAIVTVRGPARADDQTDQEKQAGQQLFDQLKSQGEIVKSSPLYDILNPIATNITKVIQPQYPLPIHFYIVHENQPNAFAAPGGNIYVVDSLFYFVKNVQELEGTICHETSHLIHHDSMGLMKKDQAATERALAATILLGPSIGTALAMTAIARLQSLSYSRQAEEHADLTGSDTCAKAGYNPWGLVWLFRDFSNANLKTPPEILSDHPNDQHRIDALEAHFKNDPIVFGGFNPDPRSATPLVLPKSEAEEFLR